MKRPAGTIEIKFTLKGNDARDFARMRKESQRAKHSSSAFARSIILEVIEDDRAMHEAAGIQGEDDATK